MNGITPSKSVNVHLGVMNAGWGVCGFTSAFHAMHLADRGTRAWLINATQAYSVLYEIRDYLESITGTKLQTDITEFTKSLGGEDFKNFSFKNYIEKIDSASAALKQSDDIKDDPEFGIAMPPHAIKDYIERAWKRKAECIEFVTPGRGDNATRAIVGVSKEWSSGKPYHGLCHYLFRGDNKFYSWGEVFADLSTAMKNHGTGFHICYSIKVLRR